MPGLYEASIPWIRRYYDRRIHDVPVVDADDRFPDARRFRESWWPLREEALLLAQAPGRMPRFHEFMAEQEEISANDGRDWRVCVLKAYGVRFAHNMRRCPRLCALVESCPDVLSATLSFLAPGKHIPCHRGPFRGVLRYTLGLVVPSAPDGRPATVMSVDGIEYRIGAGEDMLWDDTFVHEVWNRSDQVRIALLLDVRRRGMPIDATLASWLLIRIAAAGARLRFRSHD